MLIAWKRDPSAVTSILSMLF